MSNQVKKGLIPRRRFSRDDKSSFSDWDVDKLRSLANRVSERNKGGEVTRVLTNSAVGGIVDQREYFDKDIANKSNLGNYFIVERGDYVYNPRASSVAPVGPISRNKIGRGVMSPLYAVFRFSNSDNEFYEHYFKSSSWHGYVRTVSCTGARHDRLNITNDEFMDMPVPVPEPLEQQKISICLSSLEELIFAQAQKFRTLKDYKKGLMQQLFPQEGETLPRLRFPEFRNAEAWQVGKLGDENISTFVSQKMALDQLTAETYVSTENLLPDYCGVTTASSLPSSGSFTQYRKADILISNIRPYLKKVWISDRDGGSSNDVIVIRASPKLLSSFLAVRLKNDDFIAYIMRGAQGVKMPRGDISLMKNYPLTFPAKEEQQKIAACFSSLDQLIAAQSRRLDALKGHKKGLMQQLFPAAGSPH